MILMFGVGVLATDQGHGEQMLGLAACVGGRIGRLAS